MSKSQTKRLTIQQTRDVTTLVDRLRKRAEIRRSIPRGEPDRISDVLEEAADRIEELENKVDKTLNGMV